MRENSERYEPSEGGKTFRISEVGVKYGGSGDELGNRLACLNRKHLPLEYTAFVRCHQAIVDKIYLLVSY